MAWVNQNAEFFEAAQDLNHLELYLKSIRHPLAVEQKLSRMENQPLFISFKSWSFSPLHQGYSGVLKTIIAGGYDQQLKLLAKYLKIRDTTTYLAFNPYPELPEKWAPWQMQQPQLYLESFIHMAQIIRENAPAVQLVFLASGYPGCMEYHPGDSIIDANALVLYPPAEERFDAYPIYDSAEYHLLRRLHRFRWSEKTCLILTDTAQSQLNVDGTKILAEQKSLEESLQIPLTSNRHKPTNFLVGLYDPKKRLLAHRRVAAEHIFINWHNTHKPELRAKIKALEARGDVLTLTVEPFKDAAANHDRRVLENILEGRYDATLDSMYDLLNSIQTTVYLRFAHEMEIPIERYPWQSQNPLTYIKAYRYFMNYHGDLPRHIFKVWGPAGDRGSLEWYPGEDAVDFISLAIYGLPDKNIEDHREQERFREIFNRKQWRMRQVTAPIFITEFGVKGPDDFQKKWLQEAGKVLHRAPRVVGACYFNLYDNPKVWGKGEAPDWSISEEAFETFCQAAQRPEMN